jgi:hypothetical protein
MEASWRSRFIACFYAILDPHSGSMRLMPGMGYEDKDGVIDAGESALFYSDGLVEAHDPKGEMLGFPGLWALIAEHGEVSSLGTSSWKSSTP